MPPRRSVEVVLERIGLDVRAAVWLGHGAGHVDDETYDAIWIEARRRGLRHSDVLKMARHYVVGAAGPHDLAAFAEPTVEAALRSPARQWPRISGSRDAISLGMRRERLELRFLHASAEAEDPWTYTFILAAIFDRLRMHARTRLPPIRVELTLATSLAERAAFEGFFEAERGIRWSIAACGFTLHRRDGQVKLLTGDAVAARRLAGTSYRELREQTALAEARWLLAESAEPLAAIAERVGFSDQPSFTRAFSRVLGRPPGVFRDVMSPRGRTDDDRLRNSGRENQGRDPSAGGARLDDTTRCAAVPHRSSPRGFWLRHRGIFLLPTPTDIEDDRRQTPEARRPTPRGRGLWQSEGRSRGGARDRPDRRCRRRPLEEMRRP